MKGSQLEVETNLNSSEYTVSGISEFIKRSIEKNFGLVRVRGEVSGLKIAPSGHVYFSLKDQNAILAAICWKGAYAAMQVKPQEGLEMVCVGELTTYPLQSRYQLIVTDVKAAGIGALMALLEKRKQQFQKEGLFDTSHKKKLPFLPTTIGVITSPTGAVIQDILHRIEDRFPVRVLLWPVLVQGDQSAKQVATAIEGFNKMQEGRPDVLIVARGGGSIEDLWSFNEEIVVRAAFASEIPIISAIGHETDTTLLDYVADVRAPTPTAAAEFAVPLRRDLIALVDELKKRIATRLNVLVENYVQKLDELSFRLLDSINRVLSGFLLKLTVFQDRLSLDAISVRLLDTQKKVEDLWLRLVNAANRTLDAQKNLDDFAARMANAVKHNLEDKTKAVACFEQLLASFDYKNVLKRGFAVVRNKAGKVIESIAEIPDEVAIEMKDGTKAIQIKK